MLVGVAVLCQLLATSVLPRIAPGHPDSGYWTAAAVAALALMASLLAHELAHSVVARRLGLEVRGITLWLLGGVSETTAMPDRPEKEVKTALVGPLVSLLLGTVLLGFAAVATETKWSSLITGVLSWLGSMNVLLGLFNLLPGTPLDGGRVLHGLIWRRTGDVSKATRASATSGQLLGALLAAFGVLLMLQGRFDGLWLVLVGWFIAGSAAFEDVSSIARVDLDGLSSGDVMTAPVSVAPGWLTVQAWAQHLLQDRPRHSVFPVVDFEGRVLGIVSQSDLLSCPPDRWPNTAVRDIARKLPASLVIEAASPVNDLARRPWPAGIRLAAVVSSGRLAGVISRGDLVRELERAALRARVGDGVSQ